MIEMQPSGNDRFVQTKFFLPLLSANVISRSRLTAALYTASLFSPLTLVSAPAGYGKTTLLVELASLYSDLRLTWISLDEEDNDPIRFCWLLLAAFQRLNPLCGVRAQALLNAPGDLQTHVRPIMGALINDILETLPDSFLLILDDLHFITEPSIFLSLSYLLDRLPPQMHLVVSTRHDPPISLARLRARGQVVEMRLANLRFTLDEVDVFLNERMHLGIPKDGLATLQARLEGWPAGLRLLTHSLPTLQNGPERSAFLIKLIQTNHYLFDFLAEEVFNQQQEYIRRFLLETSILTDLTSSLCEAVTEHSDAKRILRDLHQRDLFISAIDDRGDTYRYHALFAEFLQHQLAQQFSPQQQTDLHRRAAEAQTFPSRAIVHYLKAHCWEEAIDRIKVVGEAFVKDGLLGTVQGWLEALPSALFHAHPHLPYLQGLCAFQTGALNAAQTFLEEARLGFQAGNDEAGQGQVLVSLATISLLTWDIEQGMPCVQQALAFPLPATSRVQLLVGQARIALVQYNWEEAEKWFETALTLSSEPNAHDTFCTFVSSLHPIFAILPHGINRLDHICIQARERLNTHMTPWQLITFDHLSASVHLWRGELEQAMLAGSHALETSRQLGNAYPYLGVMVLGTLGLTALSQGNVQTAEHFFRQQFQLLTQIPVNSLVVLSGLYIAGHFWCQQGHLAEAYALAARMETVGQQDGQESTHVLQLLLRGLIALTEQQYEMAERVLLQAYEIEQRIRLSTLWGSARFLLSYLCFLRHQTQNALAYLQPLLSECEAERTPGILLKEGTFLKPLLLLARERGVSSAFATHLLHLMGVHVQETRSSVLIPQTGKALSEREDEVLRLLATGASNRDIAKRLVISELTVKSHVSRILQKLAVPSRMQAVTLAHELGLL